MRRFRVAPKLKLSTEDEDGEVCIRIEVVDPDRFENHGLGTFMLDIENDEVEVSEEARSSLLEGQERSGVQGMEFWPNRMLAWGSRSHRFLVPLGAVNVPPGAKEWIRELK
jgi:hypothetical protein